MIIDGPDSVTEAVLSELKRAPDPRFREVMSAFVRHLHAFIREVRLTEEEFQAAVAAINAIGKATNDYHNEGVLMAGSLGVSPLVCLINNGNGQTETTANLLGPFWRMESPRTQSGGSIIRSPTPGPAMFVNVWVKDAGRKPVAGAEVDVWHSSTEGYYENQDPNQADMNLRGKFTTDADGHFAFRSVKPAGYPIPVDGPTGDLLRAQGRHNMRPAHLHFLIYKPGFKTHVSQVYVPRRSPYRQRRAVRRHPDAARQLRPARGRAGARARRERPVVFPRLHLLHPARTVAAAARADPRQGQGPRPPADAAATGARSGGGGVGALT